MKPLTPSERRDLRARAHHLDPVVIVGHHGLTPSVLHEIDLALSAHELVKVRVASDERETRENVLERACAELECAAVQHLGKVLVLWRPDPEAMKPAKAAKSGAATAKPVRKSGKRLSVLKSTERTPVDPVRSRRRARGEDEALPRARRGAGRFQSAAPADDEAPDGGRRKAAKSTYTPRTTPKSFSAKPNPRSAWQKPAATPASSRKTSAATGTRKAKPAGSSAPPAAGARRRRRT